MQSVPPIKLVLVHFPSSQPHAAGNDGDGGASEIGNAGGDGSAGGSGGSCGGGAEGGSQHGPMGTSSQQLPEQSPKPFQHVRSSVPFDTSHLSRT